MDIFSFGMVVLWLLFYEVPEYPSTSKIGPLKHQGDDLAAEARILVATNKNIDDDQKERLFRLFDLALARQPANRADNFDEILLLLGRCGFKRFGAENPFAYVSQGKV